MKIIIKNEKFYNDTMDMIDNFKYSDVDIILIIDKDWIIGETILSLFNKEFYNIYYDKEDDRLYVEIKFDENVNIEVDIEVKL